MNETRRRPTLLASVVGVGFGALVLIALGITLRSLGTDDYDGLNNMLQAPLALPWWLVVPAPTSHRADAYLTAGLGLVNAALLATLTRRLTRSQFQRSGLRAGRVR